MVVCEKWRKLSVRKLYSLNFGKLYPEGCWRGRVIFVDHVVDSFWQWLLRETSQWSLPPFQFSGTEVFFFWHVAGNAASSLFSQGFAGIKFIFEKRQLRKTWKVFYPFLIETSLIEEFIELTSSDCNQLVTPAFFFRRCFFALPLLIISLSVVGISSSEIL